MKTFANTMNIVAAVLTAASLAFAYAGLYCLNSGEGDLAGGLWFTFAIPIAGIAFAVFAASALLPRDE